MWSLKQTPHSSSEFLKDFQHIMQDLHILQEQIHHWKTKLGRIQRQETRPREQLPKNRPKENRVSFQSVSQKPRYKPLVSEAHLLNLINKKHTSHQQIATRGASLQTPAESSQLQRWVQRGCGHVQDPTTHHPCTPVYSTSPAMTPSRLYWPLQGEVHVHYCTLSTETRVQ